MESWLMALPLAQYASARTAPETIWVQGLPIFGFLTLALGVLLVVVFWGLRHARLERELEHAERMKALEMGLLLPKDQAFWTPERVAVAIGAAVPLGVFVLAIGASSSGADPRQVWSTACGIGVPAVIGGTILAARLRLSQPTRREPALAPKPYLDPANRELSEHFS